MRYEDFIDKVMGLGFADSRETADAMVKAVLGILASDLDEAHARKLTEKLPPPLTLEKLRGHQIRELNVSLNEYIAELSVQFNISNDQARELAHTVFHQLKEATGDEFINEMAGHLKPDLVEALQKA